MIHSNDSIRSFLYNVKMYNFMCWFTWMILWFWEITILSSKPSKYAILECWNIFWIFSWLVTLLRFSCVNIYMHWISYLKYDHLEAKPVGFPMDQGQRLYLILVTLFLDAKHYLKLVGKLIYSSIIWSELSY